MPPATLRRPILLSLSEEQEPPREFRLIPLGQYETTKGLFVMTPEDMQACLREQQAYGNDLSIDFGHAAFEEGDGVPRGAAGWFQIEGRDDGLWAVGVTWTPTADGMIRRREQRYISPAFDDDEGHVIRVINCALTLIPASHNLTPLVASRRSGRVSQHLTRTMSMADGKYVDASELNKLADDLEKMMGGEDKEKSDLAAMVERCRKLASDAVTASKLAEDNKEPDGDEGNKTSKASDDEGEKKMSRIVREVTGETDPARITGVLLAYKESNAQIAKLSRELADLKGQRQGAEVEEMIVKASRSGKLAPSQVKWARDYGKRDLEGLKAYIEAAPVLASMADGKAVEEQANGAPPPRVLTDADKEILRKAGVADPAAFLASQASKSA